MPARKEQTGVLLIRVWLDGSGLLARIMQVSDGEPPKSLAVVRSTEEICEVVGAWLKQMAVAKPNEPKS